MVLAYIATVVEKAHEVCIIDAPTEGWRNLQQIGKTKYCASDSALAVAELCSCQNSQLMNYMSYVRKRIL